MTARWETANSVQLEFEIPSLWLEAARGFRVQRGDGREWTVAHHVNPTQWLRPAQAIASNRREVRVLSEGGQAWIKTPVLERQTQWLTQRTPWLQDGIQVGVIEVSGPVPSALKQLRFALQSLLWQIVAVVAVLVGSILWMSTRLSRRIGRLGQELAQQLDGLRWGARDVQFKDSAHPDEIGHLSREMQRLLTDLAQYNDFLARIPRTLRHELANPMSTIQSSLELLVDESDPQEQTRLHQAATRGIAKLSSTLERVTEAANLEESLRNDRLAPVDLTRLLAGYIATCRQRFPDREWVLRVPSHPS